MTFKGLKPYTPSFDGSDTRDLVQDFLARGGEVQRVRTHSKATGEIRYAMNPTRQKDS